MKKIVLSAFMLLLLGFSLFGCGTKSTSENESEKNQGVQQQEETEQAEEMNEKVIMSLIEDFGKKLQNVSLMAPKDVLEKSMQENYADFVTPELLSKWLKDPQNAPGRMLSSPWPDRIEIVDIEKISESEYKVTGNIIEITSTEKVDGGIAGSQPITIVVRNINDSWMIDDVILGGNKDAEDSIG